LKNATDTRPDVLRRQENTRERGGHPISKVITAGQGIGKKARTDRVEAGRGGTNSAPKVRYKLEH